MKRFVLLFTLLLLIVVPGWSTDCPSGQQCTAPITAVGPSCASANAVILNLTERAGAATVSLTGVFVATLQFEQSADNKGSWVGISGYPQPTGATATSATATGTWRFAVGGSTQLCVRASAYTSGRVEVTINQSPASASTGGGGAPTGAAGGDLSGTYPDPTVAQVNGAVVPLSADFLGSNAARQLIANPLLTVVGTTLTWGGAGGYSTNGVSGLLNLTPSATVPAAAGDLRVVTGTPDSLQFFNDTVAVSLSPRTSLMSYEGVCQDVTASFSFDTSAATDPAPACIIGANILNRAVLDFDATTDESVYGSFCLGVCGAANTWVGAVDVSVEAQANEASAASARLGIQTSCVAASEAFDQAFNAANTWAWTGDSTANHRIISTQAAITTTGCASGERLFFRFYRDADGTSGTDDLAVDLRVVAVQFTTRRP